MSLDKPLDQLTALEKTAVASNLASAKPYGTPRRVWVEDGHVFVEGHDGEIISMTPATAITMGRLLSDAGTNSLINTVMDQSRPAST